MLVHHVDFNWTDSLNDWIDAELYVFNLFCASVRLQSELKRAWQALFQVWPETFLSDLRTEHRQVQVGFRLFPGLTLL